MNLSFTAGLFQGLFHHFCVCTDWTVSFSDFFLSWQFKNFWNTHPTQPFPRHLKKDKVFPPKSFAPPWKVQEFLRNSRFLRLGETNASIKAIAGVDWRKALVIFSRMTLERLNADWKLAFFCWDFFVFVFTMYVRSLFLTCFEVCFSYGFKTANFLRFFTRFFFVGGPKKSMGGSTCVNHIPGNLGCPS